MKDKYQSFVAGAVCRHVVGAVSAWGLFTAACAAEVDAPKGEGQETNVTTSEGADTSSSAASTNTNGNSTQNTSTSGSVETQTGPQCPGYTEGVADGSLVVLYTSEPFGPDPANLVGVIDGTVYFTANSKLQRVPLAGGATEVLGDVLGSSARLVGTDRLLWLRDETGEPLAPSQDSSTADLAPPNTSDDTEASGDAGSPETNTEEATGTSESESEASANTTSSSSGGSDETSTSFDEFVIAPLNDLTNITTVTRGVSAPENILANETHVIWSTRDPANIYHAPVSGEGTSVLVPGGLPTGSVIHGTVYYWMDFLTDALQRVAVSGGDAEILTEIFYGGEMTAYGDAVFWADSSSPSIEKWTDAGGHEDLASFSNFSGPEGLSAYDDKVYFFTGFGSSDFYSMSQSGGEISLHVCDLPSGRQIMALEEYVLISTDLGLVRITRP